MRIQASLEANAQLAECRKTDMSSFDHLAVAPQFLTALNAPAGDLGQNTPALQMFPAVTEFVAFVRMQFVRALARTPW